MWNVSLTVGRWIIIYLWRWRLSGKNSILISVRSETSFNPLSGHLVRPLEANDVTPKKIRAIQFLTRINDGDKFDVSFDSQEDLTPLESALSVLDSIREELPVPQKDLERVHKSIREMLVIVCIKNQAFDKAKEVLMKYFPKSMVGKKAIFLGLVNKRSSEHSVLQQVTYQQFKQEMLHFCESLFPFSHPFLSRAARKLMVKRRGAGQDAEEGDCPSDPQPEEHLVPTTEEKASRHKFSYCDNMLSKLPSLDSKGHRAPQCVDIQGAPQCMDIQGAPQYVDIQGAPQYVDIQGAPQYVDIQGAPNQNQIKFIYIALRTSAEISKCCTETQPKTPNSKQCM
uniref:Telomere repeat-binding factor dimerisation domain-containing protein n=1 Tax=Salmo trutta TaxID=8032 RepID=A0A674BLS0_SALTR